MESLIKKAVRSRRHSILFRFIGSVLGGFDGRRGFIYHLAVDLACRRVGIGRALMEAIEEQLARKGCIRYYLLVADENNDAHEFYKKFGCELLDVEIYARNLSPRR